MLLKRVFLKTKQKLGKGKEPYAIFQQDLFHFSLHLRGFCVAGLPAKGKGEEIAQLPGKLTLGSPPFRPMPGGGIQITMLAVRGLFSLRLVPQSSLSKIRREQLAFSSCDPSLRPTSFSNLRF